MWLDEGNNRSRRLTFPTLAAAVRYAERYGLDYWIERPRQHPYLRRALPALGQLRRSWLAHLARHERNGRIYMVDFHPLLS
jgi:hypothetical protein